MLCPFCAQCHFDIIGSVIESCGENFYWCPKCCLEGTLPQIKVTSQIRSLNRTPEKNEEVHRNLINAAS